MNNKKEGKTLENQNICYYFLEDAK